jgi:ATP-dependent helicase/nuclease subunit B
VPTPATLADLVTLLDSGATLLLPNARAARDLRWEFDQCQQTLGRAAWEPARVLSWDQWTASLWAELIVSGSEPRLLLNAAQEHSLWREIIAADPAAGASASLDSLAGLAASAWQLAAAYNATLRLRAAAFTHDSRTFAEWAASFFRLCATRGYLSTALLEDALRHHVEASTLAAPSTINLVGFNEHTPAQESLLTAMAASGAERTDYRLEATNQLAPPAQLFRTTAVAPTEREELILAARWIRNVIEARTASSLSTRVAVLVSTLSDDRGELDEVFREVLAPELQSVRADLSSTPWETTGGVPLASAAMIAVALDLVRWAAGALPVERASALLLSPFLADERARDAAARFDVEILRRSHLLRPEITLAALASMLEGPRARALSPGRQPPLLWPRRLHSFLERSGDLSRLRTFAEWMEFVRHLLHAANWAGSGAINNIGQAHARSLTSVEAAAAEAWDGLLDLIASLDFAGRRVTFSRALDALERRAQTSVFAPPATHAPVQIMSPDESAGSIFDAAIMLRTSDVNWPSPQSTNPLLPWPLQRGLAMPGTDPVRTAQLARAFTANLFARSSSVLFTVAAENLDGPIRPSPLLAEFGLPLLGSEEFLSPPAAAEPVSLETVPDVLALPPPRSAKVRGGAQVLKLQAACGFRAFAELRLRAEAPERMEIGLDARESGTLIHQVLQLFWYEMQTQDALRAMSADQRTAALSRCLDEVLSSSRMHTSRAHTPWDTAYLALQKDRQLALLQQWLDQELQRGQFSIASLENRQEIELGPLRITVQTDRVDRVLTDGVDQAEAGVFLVDYKTGYNAATKLWEDSRPDEPQLPLYALSHPPGELKGLAFAHLRAGKMAWQGYQDAAGILPAATAKNTFAMDEKTAGWRTALTLLAEDFHAGRAEVNPKLYPQTCTHCGQRLLCRVDPALLHQTPDADDAEGETEPIDG